MTTVSIRIGQETGRVFVKSPYNSAFVAQARNLNGKWASATTEWVFDARDEQRVRDICLELYGTDGIRIAAMVTLRVALGGADSQDITLGGRSLVRRKGRDYRVELGEGVVIISGGFPSCGGSVKNPRVDPQDDTVLEVRDYPRALAETLLGNTARPQCRGFDVQIISESEPTPAPVADPLTIAVEAGLAKINSEGAAVDDKKVKAIAVIRAIMAEHGLSKEDI